MAKKPLGSLVDTIKKASRAKGVSAEDKKRAEDFAELAKKVARKGPPSPKAAGRKTPASKASAKTSASKPRASAPTSKAAADKAPARKGGKKGGPREKMLAELVAILPELDEEGIGFLLEQSRVHRYNMETDKLNRVIEARAGRGSMPSSSGTTKGAGFSFEMPEEGGETYHIVLGGSWKMFAKEEMSAMARIACAKCPEAVAARRLHAWLSRERSDALSDFGLGKPDAPGLVELVKLFRKTFKPKAG